MTTTIATVGNHLVIRDDVKTWRWFDVFGPNATRWFLNPNLLPADDTTGIPTGMTGTKVNASTLTFVAGDEGGAILLTAGGAENDGIQLQACTEGFYCAQKWPAHFGCRLKGDDVDQIDFLVGLAITDTTALDAVSDGIYFRTVDESALLYFVTEKDGVESAVAVATLADDTYIVLEFTFDGANVCAYVDGALVATVPYTAATFPNDEYLTPTIAMLSGEAAANKVTVNWARALQVREAVQ